MTKHRFEPGIRIDWDLADDRHDFSTVPEGEYLVRVAEVRPGSTRDGTLRWALRLVVVDGDLAGRQAAWDSIHHSKRGLARVRHVLKALGLPDLVADEYSLVGCRARVRVVHATYTSPSGAAIRRCEVPYEGWSPA